MPPPTVVPRVQGNIQLEWHSGDIDIEIYIDAPDSVRFFAYDAKNVVTAEGSLVGREQELREWLERLASDSDFELCTQEDCAKNSGDNRDVGDGVALLCRLPSMPSCHDPRLGRRRPSSVAFEDDSASDTISVQKHDVIT